MAWQIQEAKARFSELVQRAIDDGPQTITRRGKDVAVVLSAEQFELMMKRQVDFKELLAAAPLEGVDLERDKSMPREFEW
jgi:prevent-host-death family protein